MTKFKMASALICMVVLSFGLTGCGKLGGQLSESPFSTAIPTTGVTTNLTLKVRIADADRPKTQGIKTQSNADVTKVVISYTNGKISDSHEVPMINYEAVSNLALATGKWTITAALKNNMNGQYFTGLKVVTLGTDKNEEEIVLKSNKSQLDLTIKQPNTRITQIDVTLTCPEYPDESISLDNVGTESQWLVGLNPGKWQAEIKLKDKNNTVGIVSSKTLSVTIPESDVVKRPVDFEGNLEVIAPNGGETWAPGSKHRIIWKGGHADSVIKIQLYENDVYDNMIVLSMNNTGIVWWTIPDTLPTGSKYKVRIVDVNEPTNEDLSNANFTITDGDSNVGIDVELPDPVQQVAVSPATVALKQGDIRTLTAAVTPATAIQNVYWMSSNPRVATVNSQGKVWALDEGVALISAVSQDDPTKVGKCRVTVGTPVNVIIELPDPVTSVTLSAAQISLAVNATQTLTATVTPATALQQVYWESSNTAVATVDDNGVVKAKAAGKAVISVTSLDDPDKTDSCVVTVP